MKAFKYIAFILGIILIATTSFSNDMVNFTYFTGDDSLDFVFIFSGEPEDPKLSEVDYGRYIEFSLPGNIKDGQEISKFLGYSPIVGFKANSGKGVLSIRFDMLLPQLPEYEVVANTLRISFPRKSLKIDEFSSYTDSGNSGNRPSIVSLLAVLREYLDVNLVIDEDSIGGTQANFVMLSDSIRAEDFFLQIIMNNPSIGYAFLPNRTVYVVKKDQIEEKVKQILSDVSISPTERNYFWSSYSFNIAKTSELYVNFTKIRELQDKSTDKFFDKEAFMAFILQEFGRKYSKSDKDLSNDIIVLPQGSNNETGVSIGVMLYGDSSLHEKFENFMGFLEGVEKPGDSVQNENAVIEEDLPYSPLLRQEVEGFMSFYTGQLEFMSQTQEKAFTSADIKYDIDALKEVVIIEGPTSEVKKITAYLKNYIKDRKNRGNEKLDSFKVKDGAGKVFALALSRTFPNSIITADGLNVRNISNKPTFQWTVEDLTALKSEDGNPDEISILGSNYEVLTAKRIADDKMILQPPLDSVIKIIPISGKLPDKIFESLTTGDSSNSIKQKFPTVEIDFSFSPLMIMKGKPQDIETLEGYIKEIEELWLTEFENYLLFEMSETLLNDAEFVQNIEGYIKIKWPDIEINRFNSLGYMLLKGRNTTSLSEVKSFIEESGKKILEDAKVYSQLVYFTRLSDEDVRTIWTNLYQQYGVNILFLQTLESYRVYGPEEFVKAMVNELKDLDVTKIIGRNASETVSTEFVKINITELKGPEIIKLAAVKVPGVQVEEFEAGGYFITGTSSQIEKTKEMLNMLSSDFMDESSILQLTTGVNYQTIESVLGLYYDISNQINILDLGNSRILLKGQKEITDNAKLILRSFELVEKVEGVEAPYVKTYNFKIGSEENAVSLTANDLINVVKAYYPSLKAELFESSKMILLVGRKSDVEEAVLKMDTMINQKYPTLTEKIDYSVLYDRTKGEYLSAQEVVEIVSKKLPSVFITVADDNHFELRGKKDEMDSALQLIMNYSKKPAITIQENGELFNVHSQGLSVSEVTEEIAHSISSNPKIFIPTSESTITCKLTLNDVSWEKWLNIIERLYDFDVQTITGLAEPIYAIIPPDTEMKTGTKKQRVLNISQGFEEVSSLITTAYGGQVYTDEINGVVIFTGISDSQMEQLKPLIKKTVKPKRLVEISALVLEEGDKDQLIQSLSMNIGASTPTISLDSSKGFSISSSIMDFTDFSKLLTAITKNITLDISYNNKKENGGNNFMSRPFITTTSGKEAYIHIGNTSTYEVTLSNSTQTNLVTNETGYELTITPLVRDNDTIKLEVNISVSYAADPAPQSLFSKDERTANTEVIVKNGDTFVIGGLKGETIRKSLTKVPFIGDLPFLGQFFRNETDIKEESTINIFITPKIIELEVPEDEIFGMNTD